MPGLGFKFLPQQRLMLKSKATQSCNHQVSGVRSSRASLSAQSQSSLLIPVGEIIPIKPKVGDRPAGISGGESKGGDEDMEVNKGPVLGGTQQVPKGPK